MQNKVQGTVSYGVPQYHAFYVNWVAAGVMLLGPNVVQSVLLGRAVLLITNGLGSVVYPTCAQILGEKGGFLFRGGFARMTSEPPTPGA